MRPTRIYADFNGLVSGARNPARTAVVLDTAGSLRDLSNAGITLFEGLPLIAVDWSDDVQDLEGHGTAQFDDEQHWWVVEFDEFGVRYVPAGDRSPVLEFCCPVCWVNMLGQPGANGGGESALVFAAMAPRLCPSCGADPTAPLRPPGARPPGLLASAEAADALVRELLRRWDPLGVNPGRFAPADEYDSYSAALVSMVIAGATSNAVAQRLGAICTSRMGMSARPLVDHTFAELIVASMRARGM